MMVEQRSFGRERASAVPRPGCRGLFARVIQVPAAVVARVGEEELAHRLGGHPIVLDRPNSVVALYFERDGEMDEHDAPEPILFVVTGGRGFVRVGGAEGETVEVAAGDAILWPARTLHRAWTDGEEMRAIAVHYAADD